MVVNAELNRKVPPQQRILSYLSVTVLTTFIHLCNSDLTSRAYTMCFTFLHSRQTKATKPRSVKLSFAKTFHKMSYNVYTVCSTHLLIMSATSGCGCSSRNVQDEQQVFIGINNIIAFTFFFTSGGTLSKDMMAFYKEQNKFSFARSLLSHW